MKSRKELKARADKMYCTLKDLSGNRHFYDPRVIPEIQCMNACGLIKEYEQNISLIDKGNKSK